MKVTIFIGSHYKVMEAYQLILIPRQGGILERWRGHVFDFLSSPPLTHTPSINLATGPGAKHGTGVIGT